MGSALLVIFLSAQLNKTCLQPHVTQSFEKRLFVMFDKYLLNKKKIILLFRLQNKERQKIRNKVDGGHLRRINYREIYRDLCISVAAPLEN